MSRSEERVQEMYLMYSPVVTILNGAQRAASFPWVGLGEAKVLLLLDSCLVDLLEQPGVFP